jgi:hypothetical protein
VDECRHDAINRKERERNLVLIEEIEAASVRITVGPAGRCFEMATGELLTIGNEQPRDSPILHIQHLLPITQADAEDFYGWTLGSLDTKA